MPVFEAGRRAGLGLEPRRRPGDAVCVGPVGATGGPELSVLSSLGSSGPGRAETSRRWCVCSCRSRSSERRPTGDGRACPGAQVAGVDNPALGGILKLGGALKRPTEAAHRRRPWDQPFPRPLQEDLARLINLADDYQVAGRSDPIVTPPPTGAGTRSRSGCSRSATALPPSTSTTGCIGSTSIRASASPQASARA